MSHVFLSCDGVGYGAHSCAYDLACKCGPITDGQSTNAISRYWHNNLSPYKTIKKQNTQTKIIYLCVFKPYANNT